MLLPTCVFGMGVHIKVYITEPSCDPKEPGTHIPFALTSTLLYGDSGVKWSSSWA